ncbi:unnamed protein product [Cylicostephanus goldi]|uniref:SEA domain-containing protein n=1 Tax=Cylicostephanus goldi TaxID=71465 RepID=A0A3P6S2Q1_CYLGO|nr:unnamed protein product [Cylicostephanus goldi]
MVYFFILSILFISAQACPPPISTIGPSTTSQYFTTSPFTYPATTVTTKPEPEAVQVTVVTRENYDLTLNDSHLQAVKALINDYAKINGIVYNENFVRESIRNEGGKFAIVFNILGVACDQVCLSSC